MAACYFYNYTGCYRFSIGFVSGIQFYPIYIRCSSFSRITLAQQLPFELANWDEFSPEEYSYDKQFVISTKDAYIPSTLSVE